MNTHIDAWSTALTPWEIIFCRYIALYSWIVCKFVFFFFDNIFSRNLTLNTVWSLTDMSWWRYRKNKIVCLSYLWILTAQKCTTRCKWANYIRFMKNIKNCSNITPLPSRLQKCYHTCLSFPFRLTHRVMYHGQLWKKSQIIHTRSSTPQANHLSYRMRL